MYNFTNKIYIKAEGIRKTPKEYLQRATTDLQKRFWSKVILDSSGCWIWRGKKTLHGYGYIQFNNLFFYAHIIAFQFSRGLVPEHLTVLQECNNTLCVNPSHLTLGKPLKTKYERDVAALIERLLEKLSPGATVEKLAKPMPTVEHVKDLEGRRRKLYRDLLESKTYSSAQPLSESELDSKKAEAMKLAEKFQTEERP